MLYSIGGIELDGWYGDYRRDYCNGADGWTHGYEGDCSWYLSGYIELCDCCLLTLDNDPSRDNDYDSISSMVLLNDIKSMENTEMSELLGTAWWTLLCLIVGCGAGIYIYPWLKNRFNK
jgi:hypothetical protein